MLIQNKPRQIHFNLLKLSPLAGFLVLYILWRLASLFFINPAVIADSYEEIYRGTVAKEILEGSTLPLWQYRPDNYSGGFYVIVVLIAAAFKILGPGMLALKGLSIIFGTLTLGLWFHLLEKYSSKVSAIIFAVLFTFPPAGVIDLFSASFGDHAETCFLSALSLLIYFKWIQPVPSRSNSKAVVGLGILAGFSVWFAYIYGITLLSILIFQMHCSRLSHLERNERSRHDRNFGISPGFARRNDGQETGAMHFEISRRKFSPNLKSVGRFFLALAAGFSPWILMNLATNFQSAVVQGVPVWESFSAANLAAPFRNPENLFLFRAFSETFSFKTLPFSHYLLGIVYLLLLLTLTLQTWQLFIAPQNPAKAKSGSLEKLTWIYLCIFIIISQAYSDAALRYLLPAFPFAIAFASIFLSRLESRFSRSLGILLIAGLAIAGIVSGVSRFSWAHAGEFLSRKGYSYKTLNFSSVPARERILSLLKKENTAENSRDLLMALAGQLEIENNFKNDFMFLRRQIGQDKRPFFEFMAGKELQLRGLSPVQIQKRINPFKSKFPQIYKRLAAGSLGESIENSEYSKNLSFDFWSITGQYFFEKWRIAPRDAKRDLNLLKNFPEPARFQILQGTGERMAKVHFNYYSSPRRWWWKEWKNMFGAQALQKGIKKTYIRLGLTKAEALQDWPLRN